MPKWGEKHGMQVAGSLGGLWSTMAWAWWRSGAKATWCPSTSLLKRWRWSTRSSVVNSFQHTVDGLATWTLALAQQVSVSARSLNLGLVYHCWPILGVQSLIFFWNNRSCHSPQMVWQFQKLPERLCYSKPASHAHKNEEKNLMRSWTVLCQIYGKKVLKAAIVVDHQFLIVPMFLGRSPL